MRWNAIRDALGIKKSPTPEEREMSNILSGKVPGEVEVGRTNYSPDGINVYDRNEEDGR